MGVTRDPSLGSWTVFEGNLHVTDLQEALPFRGDVNRPVDWPVVLRVHRIVDGIGEHVDVEVREDLTVEVVTERVNLRTGDEV